jgi:cellulose synthase/poly-beta-1,6-N-acetylglucosamine synthase-like glycosyltransferase
MILFAEIVILFIWMRITVLCALSLCFWWKKLPQDHQIHPQNQVSVIVPAFNEEKHIELTLLSLLSHEPKPWEIIVVDDGSTDMTAKIAYRCLAGFDRATVIELPVNVGKAKALNAGIQSASGNLIATIDADTRLEQYALGSAITTIMERQADAVAFYLDVDNQSSLLGLLQRQEYIASMNFERMGQDVIGAISILPGAATLFRRELLIAHPFSTRTRTEDADLTLSLAQKGSCIVLAEGAVALTVVPDTWADLFAQRTRWITGHLQCCVFHTIQQDAASWYFRAVILPNFALSTLTILAGLLAIVTIVIEGHTSLLRLKWIDTITISIGLVYFQRSIAWLLAGTRRTRIEHFLLEPLVTNCIGTICFIGSLYSLVIQSSIMGHENRNIK